MTPSAQESAIQNEITANHTFERICEFIRRYVCLGNHETTAIALWVMMTHALDAFDCVPYVAITSAEKRSGKTRLLEVLDLLVARPWLTGRTTPAVLARKIDAETPTLLFDESDATFKGDKDFAQALRGVLNTGYLRRGRTSLCVMRGSTAEFRDFSTFGPKAIAGIGWLPDTINDRSIPLRLRRKLPGDEAERFRYRFVEPEAEGLREELERWAKTFDWDGGEPKGLDALPDRAADIWEPLLLIAQACGNQVAAQARQASAALSGYEREDDSLPVRLLADIRTIFEEAEADRMPSAELARRLAAIEESPWAPRFGRDFDARALASKLRAFEIKPARTVRFKETTAKGYHLDDFADAFARYLPSHPSPSSQDFSERNLSDDPVRHVATASVTQLQSTLAWVDDVPSQPTVQSHDNSDEIRTVTNVPDVTQDGPGSHFFTIVPGGDGRLAACMRCGGVWEMHGSPEPDLWRYDHAEVA